MRELEDILNKIGPLIGEAISKENAIELDRVCYLKIEYNSVYKGYNLYFKSRQTGAIADSALGLFNSTNLTKKEMKSYLIGYLNGVQLMN